jgi:hypothetical protein
MSNPNPYATPNSPVDDPPTPQDGKRPKLVWVIFLFSLLGVVSTLATTWLMATGNFPAPSEAHYDYMENIPPYQHAISVAGIAVYLAAAIALFRMKAVAFTLYAVHFGVTVVAFAVNWFNPHYQALIADAGAVPGLTGLAIGWGVTVAILCYAYRLRRQGRLR